MKKKAKQEKHQQTLPKMQRGKHILQSSSHKNQDSQAELTQQFSQIFSQICESSFFKNRVKHIKIKLETWVEVLSKHEFNSAWRANKLHYLKLLNLMCQCEYLTAPFTSFPNPNFLPILQKHQINQIIDAVEKQVRSGKLQTKRNKKLALPPTNRKNSIEKSKPTLTSGSSRHISRTRTHLMIDDNQGAEKWKVALQHRQNQISKQNQNLNSQKKMRRTVDALELKRAIMRPLPIQQENNRCSEKSRNSQTISKRSHQMNSLTKLKQGNSISDSINLYISPVTVSSQIWKYAHEGKHTKDLNKTVEFSKRAKKSADISSRSYQSNNTHLERLNLEPAGEKAETQKKQYWEIASYTGNVTPKYLSNFKNIGNVSVGEQEELVTYRSSEKYCECIQGIWSSIGES